MVYCLAALSLVLAGPALAQPAVPPPAADVVVLSPFSVTAGADRGYSASETMTGSRVRTQIIDLPYSVNVLTSEFFEDFGMFELADNVTQVSSFTGLDVGGNFVLRGFISSNQLRDGFFRLGRYGASNIDRMEVIKGSSAAIYGRTSPGGMMNMISKRPKDTAGQQLSLNFGDYGTQRVTLEATGPVTESKLGETKYLFTASHYSKDLDVDYTLVRNKEYFFALEHAFRDGSKLFASYESFAQERKSPLSPAPLIVDQKGTAATTDDQAIGYALNLSKISSYGPNSQLNRGNTSFTASYEKTLNPVFSMKLSSNFYMARRDDYNQNMSWGTVNINRSNGAAPTSTRGSASTGNNAFVPSWGRIFEDGGSFQADLLTHYWTNDRRIEHRTLLTFDYNDYYRWDPTLRYSASTHPDAVAWNARRTVTLDANYDPVGTVFYFPNWHDPANGYVLTRKMRRRTTVLGGLLRHQAALMDGRLLAFTGARFDSASYRHHDFLTAASSFTGFNPNYKVGDRINKTITHVKPNLGVNYNLGGNVRAFANYSESYFIAQGDNPVEIADPSFKAEVADGWDYGFKGSLLGNQLNYTLCGFYINRENVSVDDLDPVTGLSVSRRDGSQLVRGYEIDLNWAISKEMSLLGSFGRVNSKYTDFGTANPQAIGRKVQYISPHNGNVSVKYSPSQGFLRGFSANLGMTWVGETPTEAPNAGDVLVTTPGTTQRVVTSSTGQWKLTAPAYSLWSGAVRYTTQGQSKFSHTYALNVNNMLGEGYYRPGTSGASRIQPGDKRSIFFTYTLRHKGGAR